MISAKYLSDDEYQKLQSELYEKFTIEDNDENEQKWEKLKYDFAVKFIQFTYEDDTDYGFASWHNNVLSLWLYVYNNKIYSPKFADELMEVLVQNGNCFAEIECFDENGNNRGWMIIYDNQVHFDELSVKSGFPEKMGIK